MKAVIWTAYGPPQVLQLQEVEQPVPKDGEVLVRIHAATVTAGDCELRSLKMPLMLGFPMRLYAGFSKPTRVTILGQELAGEIAAVGRGVHRFRVGQRVFGTSGFGGGTYAEYTCLPGAPGEMGGALAEMPSNLTYEQAAAVPLGGLEALHFLRRAAIKPGQSVLINGAGGSIGTMGVQLAKHFGARVTAVDSTAKLEMLRSIGADQVLDYTREDFTRRGERYDVVFDVVGRSPFWRSLRSLKRNGFYLIANPRYATLFLGWPASRLSGRRVFLGTSSATPQDLDTLRELIEAGRLTPVLDRSYPLEETAEAHRYVESGMKQGNVVIRVRPEPGL